MSTTARDLRVPLVASAGLGAAILAFAFTSNRRHKSVDNDYGGGVEPVPVAACGAIETAVKLSGKEAPDFFLEMAKECDSTIYKLNLPVPGGIYVVGDGLAQREVLTTSEDKPSFLYQSMDSLSGKPSIFSLPTKDPTWKTMRKGAAPAFSGREVNRMNDICAKHVKEWMDKSLKTYAENGTSFDPSVDMNRLTFYIIMESAFEYNVTEEEYSKVTKVWT